MNYAAVDTNPALNNCGHTILTRPSTSQNPNPSDPVPPNTSPNQHHQDGGKTTETAATEEPTDAY